MQPRRAAQSTDNTPLMHRKLPATKPFACYHLKEPVTSRDVLELPPQLRCHSTEEMRTFNSLPGCSRLDRWFWRYKPNSAEHANMRTVLLLTVRDAYLQEQRVYNQYSRVTMDIRLNESISAVNYSQSLDMVVLIWQVSMCSICPNKIFGETQWTAKTDH